jgi:hypothetical protein
MSLNHITNSRGDADYVDIYVKDIRARDVYIDGVGNIYTPAITTTVLRNPSDKIYTTSIPTRVQLSTVSPAGFITQLDDVSYSVNETQRYNQDTTSYVNVLKVKLFYRFTTPLPPASVDTQWLINLDIPVDYLNASVIYSSSELRTQSSATGAPNFGIRSILTDSVGVARVFFGAPSHLDIFPSPNFNQVAVEFELNRGY